jgi:glucokinase
MEKLALGIDIGGTNCAFGLVNKEGIIIYENNVKTNSFNFAVDFVDYLNNDKTISNYKNQIIGIGIGAPNGNHFTGEIQFAPNLPWEKGIIPLKKYFEERFKIKTLLTNDANAAAEGEKHFGCAQNLTDFIVITLGTGLGSGIYINNELVVGKHGLAGEYGHIVVKENGRNCKCGRNGCLETYASSTGIVRSFEEFRSNYQESELFTFEKVTAKDIFEQAIKNDPFALYLTEYTASILGIALANFTAFSDPQAFILFGGIAQSGEFFKNKVEKYFNESLLNIYQNNVEIRISSLHDKNAAILGNAATIFTSEKN